MTLKRRKKAVCLFVYLFACLFDCSHLVDVTRHYDAARAHVFTIPELFLIRTYIDTYTYTRSHTLT